MRAHSGWLLCEQVSEARQALDAAEAQVAALEQEGNKLKSDMTELAAQNDKIGSQSEAACREVDVRLHIFCRVVLSSSCLIT